MRRWIVLVDVAKVGLSNPKFIVSPIAKREVERGSRYRTYYLNLPASHVWNGHHIRMQGLGPTEVKNAEKRSTEESESHELAG